MCCMLTCCAPPVSLLLALSAGFGRGLHAGMLTCLLPPLLVAMAPSGGGNSSRRQPVKVTGVPFDLETPLD